MKDGVGRLLPRSERKLCEDSSIEPISSGEELGILEIGRIVTTVRLSYILRFLTSQDFTDSGEELLSSSELESLEQASRLVDTGGYYAVGSLVHWENPIDSLALSTNYEDVEIANTMATYLCDHEIWLPFPYVTRVCKEAIKGRTKAFLSTWVGPQDQNTIKRSYQEIQSRWEAWWEAHQEPGSETDIGNGTSNRIYRFFSPIPQFLRWADNEGHFGCWKALYVVLSQHTLELDTLEMIFLEADSIVAPKDYCKIWQILGLKVPRQYHNLLHPRERQELEEFASTPRSGESDQQNMGRDEDQVRPPT